MSVTVIGKGNLDGVTMDRYKATISLHEHIFKIVKGSGRKFGSPQWKCIKCPKRVIAM